MKDPLKPRDKITQKMTRDGAIAENQTTGDTERISKRTQDADFQKSPEQQAAQDAAQLQGAASPTSPLPHVPGAAPKADTGKTERVMEHIEAAHTRKASKKAVRRAQAEATAGTKSSRLQFTDEELSTPELEKYIKKSDKAADRLDKAKAAIPKEKKLVKERTFDEATGKGKTRLHFEEKDKPPGFKDKHSPLSRPAQEAGILVHNKIHSVEKDNSGVEGAHKSEEAAERGAKYGVRKIKQGYRSHKLKPYREAAKAEKAAFKANVDFQYHKTLHENPQLTSNPISRFWQKQQIKKQYAKEARNTAKGIKGAAERTRKAAAKAAEKTKQTAAFVARHPAGVAIAVGALLLFIMLLSGLSSCGAMFSGTLNGVLGTSYTSEDSDLVEVENAYAGLESGLQNEIDAIESTHPGYDEYRYDLANIGHFQQLFRGFNHMILEVHDLKISAYEAELERHRNELRYLQLQIRPHFYLNAITTISSLIYQDRKQDARSFIDFLSDYLRYLFSGSDTQVTLQQETKHCKSFIQLQQIKYPDTIFYMFELASGTENIRIPKFLLQTVVENIFKHGFSPEQFLSIFLESALEEQNGVRGLRMTVEDNGCGFPPEMLASFPVKEDNGHVGLSNLYHTLQLIYGPAASLHISNAEPNGARVTIFLPEEENHAHPSCG